MSTARHFTPAGVLEVRGRPSPTLGRPSPNLELHVTPHPPNQPTTPPRNPHPISPQTLTPHRPPVTRHPSRLPQANENRGYFEVAQPAGLALQLNEYQRQTVRWMMDQG